MNSLQRFQHITSRNLGLLLCALVVLASGVLTLYRLGSQALTDYDEATYALVIDKTAESGQIGTLKIADDKYWFEKPPLYFWIGMLTKDAFGSPQEFGLRLPAALLGIATIIGVMLIAYHLRRDYYFAALAGAIMATTPIFIEASRQVRLDIPVVTCIIFAFFCFLRGLERPRWLIGVGVFAAIGFMFKSVIGFFVFPLMLIWAIVHKDYTWLKDRYFWIGIGLMVLLLIPWHWYESVTVGSAFWHEYLLNHVLGRFSSDVVGGTTVGQNYFSYFFWYVLPWSILFVIGLWNVRRSYREKTPESRTLLALFVIPVFIFAVFEVAQTKLFYYLLPMFPFMALALAYSLYRTYERMGDQRLKSFALGGLGLLLLAGIGQTIYVAYHKDEYLATNQLLANEEKEVGLILASESNDLETYTYEYPYLETIRFYSNGVRIDNMKQDQELTESFNLIMWKPLYDSATFPPALAERFRTLYEGEALILLRFEYEESGSGSATN